MIDFIRGREVMIPARHDRWALAGLVGLALLMILACGPEMPPEASSQASPEGRHQHSKEDSNLRSLVPADQLLPRDGCELLWEGIEGARYSVAVTDEQLTLLAQGVGLTEASYRLTPTALVHLAPGDKILWQVEATLPSGVRHSSQTFVARLE